MAEMHRAGQARRGGGGLLCAVVVLLGFSAIGTAAVARASRPRSAAVTGWKVVPTPNKNTTIAGINELTAVSCTSGQACTAVGLHEAGVSSSSFSLAERWNGTAWKIQPTILPPGAESTSFSGVSCVSATACTAVGGAVETTGSRSVNLAEAWNGTSWKVQAIVTPSGSTGGNLTAVSCTSPTACTAVGWFDDAAGNVLAVAERWNGNLWRTQPVLRPTKTTQFFAVTCRTSTRCTAVGYDTGTGGTRPLVEAWDGTGWHLQTVPLPHVSSGGLLAAVSCTSANACTATGSNFSSTSPTLAERWNGTRWRVQPTPFPSNVDVSKQEPELNAVSCSSATACNATGEYAPGGQSAYFLEAWNGVSWRLVAAPHPAGFLSGALNAVSCAPARCTAVGAWSGGPIYIATLDLAN